MKEAIEVTEGYLRMERYTFDHEQDGTEQKKSSMAKIDVLEALLEEFKERYANR